MRAGGTEVPRRPPAVQIDAVVVRGAAEAYDELAGKLRRIAEAMQRSARPPAH